MYSELFLFPLQYFFIRCYNRSNNYSIKGRHEAKEEDVPRISKQYIILPYV
jgi:hypothetical protein